MSVVGVSPSDFFAVAKAIHKTYNTYKNGSQTLQEIVDSLKELELQAESLQSIIEVADVEDCPQYGGFSKLKTDLLGIETFLAKFQRLSDQGASIGRAVDATSLTLQQNELTNRKETLAHHRARLESYKTQLIIHALYNKHRAGTGIILARDTEDDDRILQRALEITQQRRQSTINVQDVGGVMSTPRSFISNTSTLVARPSESARIQKEIITRVEDLRLYRRDNVPQDNPEAWAEIIDRLAALIPDRRPSVTSIGSFSLPWSTSPEGLAHGRDGRNDTMLHVQIPSPTLTGIESHSPTAINLTSEPVQSPSARQNSSIASPLLTAQPRMMGERRALHVVGKVHVRWENRDWMDVRLEISRNEHATQVWAVTSFQSSRSGMSNVPSRAITPQDVLEIGAGPSSQPSEQRSLVIKHTILSSVNSYPKVHHPHVEKGLYSVEFDVDQCVEIEGVLNSPRVASQYTYKFEFKADRDTLRTEIFGKRLLVSAGYSKIEPAGACDMQALAVWEDHRPTLTGMPNTYITFPCNRTGKQTNPDRVLMFRIIACPKLLAAKEKGRALSLKIETISDAESAMSGRKEDAKNSRKAIHKIKESNTCKIFLSEQTESLRADKKSLIRVLKSNFEGG